MIDDLKLHDATELHVSGFDGSVVIFCVPGGFIYLFNGISSVFVPRKTRKKTAGSVTVDTAPADSFFEHIWTLYPRRNGRKVGKKEGKEWMRANYDKINCIEMEKAVKNYATVGLPRDIIRFFRNGYWKYWIEDSVDHSEELSDDLVEYLRYFDRKVVDVIELKKLWSENYGSWSDIFRSLRDYWTAVWINTEKKYIPGPIGFLKKKKWLDGDCVSFLSDQDRRIKEIKEREEYMRQAKENAAPMDEVREILKGAL